MQFFVLLVLSLLPGSAFATELSSQHQIDALSVRLEAAQRQIVETQAENGSLRAEVERLRAQKKALQSKKKALQFDDEREQRQVRTG